MAARIGTKVKALALLTGVIGLAACTGGTDGGEAGDENFTGDQFVAGDSTTGSISLSLNQDTLSVSDTAGFIVEIKDRDGQPVSGVTVSCDSERGVAIVEPSTGSEITGTGGAISGVIGCAAPGSYQFGCRMATGAGRRKLVTVKCDGDIPTGFGGFPGAAGGGLNGSTGGSGDISDGGTGGTDLANGVRITGVTFPDTGDPSVAGSASIDTAQNLCSPDTDFGTADDNNVCEATYEAFDNTYVAIKVVNNTNSTITFTSYDYTVGSASETGIGLIGVVEVGPNGAEETIYSLFAQVTGSGPTSCNGASSRTKAFLDGTVASAGFTNVSLTLHGVSESGEGITKRVTTAVSFGDINRCS